MPGSASISAKPMVRSLTAVSNSLTSLSSAERRPVKRVRRS